VRRCLIDSNLVINHARPGARKSRRDSQVPVDWCIGDLDFPVLSDSRNLKHLRTIAEEAFKWLMRYGSSARRRTGLVLPALVRR
jgi:hypothetical protein